MFNMEQEVVIKVPEGKIAVQTTDKEGNIIVTFKDKEPVISKSWEEFCKNHPNAQNEFFIHGDGTIAKYPYRTVERFSNTINHLATKEDAKGIIALIQLTRLHDEWVGDWKSSSKKEYYAISYNLEYNDLRVGQWWNTRKLLAFPTKEMAEEFLDCFRDLIEKAVKFI